MIDTPHALEHLVEKLQPWATLSLDTEADSLHSYPEKLCLLQLSADSEDFLVDPLANLDLAGLLSLMRDRELVLHGADYDLRMLHRTYRFRPKQLFDTMLGARLLGDKEFGLAHLVSKYLGVTLEKGSQKANWAKRPLTARMVEYAINDTHYLQPLARLLRSLLEEKGRLAWHEQLCAQLIETCTVLEPRDSATEWRVKGCDRLDRKTLGLVRELWYWREQEAMTSGKPPFFILSHETLIHFAKTARNEGVDKVSLPDRFSPRRRESLLTALHRGHAIPESELPQKRRGQVHHTPFRARQLAIKLREERDRQALRLGIDPTLIASKATLNALGEDWKQALHLLLPWQKALLEKAAH